MATNYFFFSFCHFIMNWCTKFEQDRYSRFKATAEIRFAQKTRWPPKWCPCLKISFIFEPLRFFTRFLLTLGTRALAGPRYSGASAPSVLALRISILRSNGKKNVSILVKKIVTPLTDRPRHAYSLKQAPTTVLPSNNTVWTSILIEYTLEQI